MRPLSTMALSMPRSGIREIMERAAGLTDVIHLEVGEPDFPTPREAIDAAFEAARQGFTRYTPNAGIQTLRESIAASIRAGGDAAVGADRIVVTPGAVCALATAILALIEPGDEVLLPDPGWPNYVSMVQVARGTAVAYPLTAESRFLPSVDVLERLVTPRTKVLMLNSPANPTGAVFAASLMRDLVSFARRHDLFVVSDEVYEAFTFGGPHVSALTCDTDDRVIAVSGFSKTYAMTGWRLGYAVAPPPIASLIAKLQEPLVSCSSAPSQKAAEAALMLDDAVVGRMRDAYRSRRDRVMEILGELVLVRPDGAFYALVDLRRALHGSDTAALQLLAGARVAAAPGETFGDVARGMVRISFATEDRLLIEGCERIRRFATR